MSPILAFNILTLKLICMWPESGRMTFKYRVKGWILFVINYTTGATVVYGIIRSAFVEWDGYDALIDRVIQLLNIGACIFIRQCLVSKLRKIVNDIPQYLNEFKEFCPETAINTTEKQLQLYSKAFMVYLFFGIMSYAVGPLFDLENCNKDRLSDLFRERDPCGLVGRCFYPFDVSKKLFPMAFLIQFSSCFVISSYIVTFTWYIIGIMMHLVTQIKHCRGLINDLEMNPQLARNLRSIIIYHIKIIECLDLTNETFGTMMMLYLTLPSLIISTLGFKILIVVNFGDIMRYTLHMCGWLVLLFVVCFYGQMLIDESVALAEDVYATPWFQAPVNVRKDIHLILMRSQTALVLKASHVGFMSLPTFLGVVSSAYSYFTLLLNIKA